ncbi:MAG: hypothetical protein QG650_118 [Patescibacteria group bacterium]|nr:hypothetical protein [Patescibacteria group bacterium]
MKSLANGIMFGIGSSLAVLSVSIGYAAWSNMSHVASGVGLTHSLWNQLVDNVDYLNGQVTSLNGQVVPHGQQMFTANGTFTVPAGVTTVYVSMA